MGGEGRNIQVEWTTKTWEQTGIKEYEWFRELLIWYDSSFIEKGKMSKRPAYADNAIQVVSGSIFLLEIGKIDEV